MYLCNDEVINVYINGFDMDNVCIETNENGNYREFRRSVHTDDNGAFFTWNKCKVYLDDFIKIPIQTIKDRLERNEFVTSDELCQSILSEGIDKVRFIVPMMKVDCRFMGLVSVNPSERIDTVCHIEEEFNRKVIDGYKFKLVPDNYDGSTCSREDYYVTDFVSCLRSGYIKIA